jgi:hypothetical protein
VTEVQKHLRNEFGTPPPPPPTTTWVTVTKIRDTFEVYGAVQNVNKGSTHYESLVAVFQAYTHTLQGSL